jgi:hypothetical protein
VEVFVRSGIGIGVERWIWRIQVMVVEEQRSYDVRCRRRRDVGSGRRSGRSQRLRW